MYIPNQMTVNLDLIVHHFERSVKLKCGVEKQRDANHFCLECQIKHKMPYYFCCLDECGEHEFCRDCPSGVYLKGDNNNDC